MDGFGPGIIFLDALADAVQRAGSYNKNDQVPPAVILWPDKERLWEPLLPRLRQAVPLFTYDPNSYSPAERRGPAYYLRCLLAGTLPGDENFDDRIPVLYLPGVSKAELRAVEECPKPLQPLSELQYRGVLWTQKNGKDWTLAAFLQSRDGGLGIDVVGDTATRNALRQSLAKLADIPLAELKAHAPLKSDYLFGLLNPDDIRSLLTWIDQPDSAKERLSAEEWAAFCNVCHQKYGFNPEKDGAISAAEKLGLRAGAWNAVWERYLQAPQAYPNIPERLRTARPAAQLSLFDRSESWPQDNESEENALRKDLLALAEATSDQTCERILVLDKQHGLRRSWVWARLGQSPLANALGYLAAAVTQMQVPSGGADLDAVTTGYTQHGWQVDDWILKALAEVEPAEDLKAVRTAVRAVYAPWLETSALTFQKALADCSNRAALAQALPKPDNGICVLFSDGLRFDLARRLAKFLETRGYKCEVGSRLAALPPVTATGKPALLATQTGLSGEGMPGLTPATLGSKSALTAEAYRKMLEADGYQVLEDDLTGNPSGKAWTELGEIDAYGHEHSSKLPRHVEAELLALEKRIVGLLDAGWKSVRLVTDHGWLLLPGGLPKVQLPEHLTVLRKGRCARLKEGAQTGLQIYPWHWDADVWVAFAPGIACFEAGKEYEHGGLSPQECLLPVLDVRPAAEMLDVTVEINAVSWKGLRCTVQLEGGGPGLVVDLRIKAGDPDTSLITSVKSPEPNGRVSLLVENADRQGDAAFLVVLSEEAQLIAQQHITIGG